MTHGARKPRRPKWGLTGDTMALAIHGAAKPDRADVDHVIATIQAAHKALREGVATEMQWSVLSGSVDCARMIEKQGVVRGIHEHIASAHHALQSVYTRAMQVNPHTPLDRWRPTALHWHELDAISTFVDLHAYQIRQLSRKEFLSAITAAVGYVRGHGNVAVLTSEVAA